MERFRVKVFVYEKDYSKKSMKQLYCHRKVPLYRVLLYFRSGDRSSPDSFVSRTSRSEGCGHLDFEEVGGGVGNRLLTEGETYLTNHTEE